MQNPSKLIPVILGIASCVRVFAGKTTSTRRQESTADRHAQEESEKRKDKDNLERGLAAAYKLNDWLNFYWNFYVIFVGIVLGWFFSNGANWNGYHKAVVTVFFTGFVVFSVTALSRTYRALNATAKSIAALNWGLGFKDALLNKLSQPAWGLQIAVHIIADLGLLTCIWFLKVGPKP